MQLKPAYYSNEDAPLKYTPPDPKTIYTPWPTLSLTLSLEWPDSRLNQNGSHGHWKPHADLKAAAKARAHYQTKDLLNSSRRAQETADRLRQSHCYLEMTIVFSPPDPTRRDLDNRLTEMKGPIDGVFKALQIDDSQVKEIHLKWGPVIPGGSVILTIIGVHSYEQSTEQPTA